jgi:hypothetical protein
MKQIKKMAQRGLLDPEKEDPFALFVASTQIRYCYYHETQNILGNTYGMCVLQVSQRRCQAPAAAAAAAAAAAEVQQRCSIRGARLLLLVVWEVASSSSVPPAAAAAAAAAA